MVVLLLLKLVLPALIVLGVSVLQRRLGPAIGGRVVALPVTTTPFLLLLALQSGLPAAAHAAVGVVSGQLAVVVFCLTYATIAPARSVFVALTAAVTAALASDLFTLGLHSRISLAPDTLLVALAALTGAVVIRLRRSLVPGPVFEPDTDIGIAGPLHAWELPLRMIITTTVIGALLAASSVLGATVAGVLVTLPVILSVIVPATHRRDGARAAVTLAAGSLTTLPATTAALAVVAGTLEPWGVLPALLAGIATLAAAAAIAPALVQGLTQISESMRRFTIAFGVAGRSGLARRSAH